MSQYRAFVASSNGALLARLASVVATALLVLTGCATSVEIGTQSEPGQQSATTDGEPSGLPSPVGEGALSSAEVYEAVVQSIVFIETPDLTTGSGIVIEGGWILTNAHVVDRLPMVRIGRSDGVDLGEHSVRAVDWTFDLALIGPIDDVDLVAMERVASADLMIGDRVLLVGFPDESSVDPTPTLTEGIVSRRRRPALGDFPFLQVDATIAPGQSGGALVDGAGKLVGISGLEFGEGEFGLAFEADAMWPRVDKMIASDAPRVPSGEPISTLTAELGLHRTIGLLVETDASGHLEVNASSDADVFIDLQSLGAITVYTSAERGDHFEDNNEDTVFYVDDFIEGGEQLIADIEPGEYQVIVGSFSVSAEVEISSPNDMRRFDDLEEGLILTTGEVVEGEFDWALDSDRWRLPLTSGDSVTIVTDGIADTVLAVRFDGETIASSDDEGLGLFGTGSKVEFVAPSDGLYEVEVGTFDATRWGYLIEASIS